MLPFTAALYSSDVPASRLADANLGTSGRKNMMEKRPLGAKIAWPCGLAPYISILLPSCSSVTETSVHIPTSSLTVSAPASSMGRKTPKISADAVRAAEIMRFMVSLLWSGGYSLTARDGAHIRIGGGY